jgi:hypothetical protein
MYKNMPDATVAKAVYVHRFDYLLKGNEWTAYIAGYSQDECRSYLMSLVGDVHIVQISQESRLDALTNELRTKITEASKKKPGRPPKSPGEETVVTKK